MEALEGREVLAALTWTGAISDNVFIAGNWYLRGTTTPPSTGPSPADELYFDGAVSSVNDPVLNSPSAFSINAVRVIGGYSGRVTLNTSVSVGTLVLASAAATIDQPAVSGGTSNITVTNQFTWTGGTLNSTSNVSTVTVTGSGATALIAPTDRGKVSLGSHLAFANGAAATMNAGTIDATNEGLRISTTDEASFTVVTGPLWEAILSVSQFLQGEIHPGTSWTMESGSHLRVRGTITNAGTLTIMANAIFEVSGGDPEAIPAYTQGGASSATYLQGDAELITPQDQKIVIDNGILATVWVPDVAGSATIRTGTLQIDRGHIYVNYGQAVHVNFGELLVSGDVWWNGGTFHPFVYSGGVANDVWRTIDGGTFEIDGGTIAPIYLDTDYGTSSFPTSGDRWKVLRAGGGFVDASAPSVDDPGIWRLQIDAAGAPPIWWELIAR
ncbi:MAG: hypothetical protein C0501_01265 [Isosphaera sp.]|nr:hypothetical protein [Isosphaera sp.]